MKLKKNTQEINEIIVGLDIGTTKIAAVVGQLNQYGKVDILGFGHAPSHGVRRGVVNNIERTIEAISLAIGEASKMSNVEIHRVHVGIAGQHIRSLQHKNSMIRNNSEEEISRADLEFLRDSMFKLAMPPGEKIIHVIPQVYTVDKEQGIKDPVGMAGVCLEGNFHIISAQESAIYNIERCVNKAGLEIESLILEPLASAKAVLSPEEMEAGVVLVDIGGGTTDIAIFQENILWHTAVIALGGDVVTEDIKDGCTILRQQAEALKIKFGSALAIEASEDEIVSIPTLKGREPKEISLRNLASIIQARMEEIIEQVYLEIKSSGLEKKLIAGIVLTGGGSMLRNLKQLTEYMTGMSVRIGYPQEHLSANVPREIISPMYSTTIGLVLKGYEIMQQKLSSTSKVKKDKKTSTSFISRLFNKGISLFDEDIN